MAKWSANLICYNEEMWMPYQLQQLEKAVDEIIIVDGTHTASLMNDNDDKELKLREPHRFGLSDKSCPSTDNTRKIISEFDSKKIKMFDGDGDEQKFRNFAADNSTGDYILIIDADEFYIDLKEYLNKFEMFFHKGYEAIFVSRLYEFYFDFDHYIINFNIPVAMKKNIRFNASRNFKSKKIANYDDGICYHYSYIKPYQRISDKMKGYGTKGKYWMDDVVDKFGKISDEKLIEGNRVNKNSIHLCSRNKVFRKEKLEHPEVVKPLIEKWKWKCC